jgi:putative flavoprotein involved in K+ transport
MAEARVIVVGAGAAGLSTAGALKKRGVDAVVLDKDDRIGGTWARRYDRLHLHTIRFLSGLAHRGIPRRYPRYLARDQYVEYLNDYARHFNFDVITGCTVNRIERLPSGKWLVKTSKGDWTTDVVVVASGQYSVPIPPRWPGWDAFRGTLMHSSSYTSSAPFAGKRVLVVGSGNSGTEIAADLAEHGAASVEVSIRTTPPILPRDPFGMPLHRTGIMLSFLPTRVADFFAAVTARLTVGDLTQHGLGRAEWKPYSSHRVPVIDVGFVKALKRGALKVRPAVVKLTTDGAGFADGSTGSYDAIIAATGFRTGLDEIIGPCDLLDEAGEPKGRSGDATAHAGIYFVGYLHNLRGHLFDSNVASRRLARNVGIYLRERPMSTAKKKEPSDG